MGPWGPRGITHGIPKSRNMLDMQKIKNAQNVKMALPGVRTSVETHFMRFHIFAVHVYPRQLVKEYFGEQFYSV